MRTSIRHALFAAVLFLPAFLGAAAPVSPFGACAHLPWEADLNTELTAMKAAGIGWVRADFSWGGVEPAPGSWNFDALDRTVAAADSLDMGILPILDYNAAWGDTAWKNLDAWAMYVDRIVRRYQNSLRYWEVWNEENIPNFWKDETDQWEAHYLALLQRTWETVKAVDPELTVLLGGTAGVPMDYLENLYTLGAAAYFDAMNIHPYRYPTAPEYAGGGGYNAAEQLAALRTLMSAHGDSAKPVWITELGWPTHGPGDALWGSVIRAGLRRIAPERTQWKIAYLDDPSYPANVPLSGGALASLGPVPSSTYERILLSDLAGLSGSGFHVLVMPPNESFPAGFFDDILAFAAGGGTLVFSGGVPLYYAQTREAGNVWSSTGAGDSYRQQLGFGFEADWTNPLVPGSTGDLMVEPEFSDSLTLPEGASASRFITNQTAPGDSFISLITARADGWQGPAAALIKYGNSTLTGACIVSMLSADTRGVSEEYQAAMLARSYLIYLQQGVERIFWYEFQATENDPAYNEDHFGITHEDLSPKPAYTAYQALTRARPAGSVKVEAMYRNVGYYFPAWQRPDGSIGYALWSEGAPLDVEISFTGIIREMFDFMGSPAVPPFTGNSGALHLTGEPLYMIGPQSLTVSGITPVRSGATGLSGIRNFRITGPPGARNITWNMPAPAPYTLSLYTISGARLGGAKGVSEKAGTVHLPLAQLLPAPGLCGVFRIRLCSGDACRSLALAAGFD